MRWTILSKRVCAKRNPQVETRSESAHPARKVLGRNDPNTTSRSENMATKPLSAVRLGMEVNNITLAHFTTESVTQFLHHVADLVENRVVRSAGDSPWFPQTTVH